MQNIDLLVIPRWLVPVEPQGLVLEGHAMAVDGGRILDLLPVAEARAKYQPRETRELPQHAVMPGFINIHTHFKTAQHIYLPQSFSLVFILPNLRV